MRKEKQGRMPGKGGVKGQAALEYLMTYGWALAVIVVTVGVLIFMGILKPPSAATCTGLEKLSYDDHTVDYNGNFALYLKNGTGARISDVNAIALGDFSSTCIVSPTTVDATKDFNVICFGTGVIPGQAYKGKIKIEYKRGRYARHEENAICTGNVPSSGALITITLSYFSQSSWQDSNYSSGSDVNSDENGFLVLEGEPGSYSSFGSIVSNIFDAGSTMDWTSTIEWDEETPAGTDINMQTRTSDNNISWSSWSGYYTSSPSPITSPNGRFIQYKANLSSTNPNATPRVLEVRMHGTPIAESCGNLIKEGTEACDTNDLGGHTCISQGYVSGSLACLGNCAFDTSNCNSSLPNQAPVSILSSSTGSALVGQYITFYGNLSYDPDGSIAAYDWNFGDGNIVAGGSTNMVHNYSYAGTYNVRLAVTDNNSASDSNSVSVNITTPSNQLPVSVLSASASSANPGQYITFYGWQSYDPDGIIAAYDWNFGDGNIVAGGDKNMVHAYSAGGSYTTTLTVIDNNSGADADSVAVSITVPNQAPFAGLTASATTPSVGQYITLYGNSSYDPDGTIATYDWNFGDGNIVSSGSANMVHAYSGAGNYTATLTVTDNNSASDSNSIGITATSGGFSKTWTTEADFLSGTDVNLDTNTSGALKLDGNGSAYSPSGTWNAQYDAGAIVDWNRIIWNEETPYGEEIEPNAYDLNALWHLNESSGSIIDSSGKGNDGNNNGATTGAGGKFNTAYSFDGVNDYLRVANPIIPTGNQARTVEAWVYPNNCSSDYEVLSYGRRVLHQLFAMTFYTSSGKCNPYFASNADDIATSTMLDSQKWYHFAVTYNGTTVRMYVNGAEIGAKDIALSTNNYDAGLLIGAHVENVGNNNYFLYFNGKIDEVSIYGHALGANEIREHYKRGALNLSFRTKSAATQGGLAGASWSSWHDSNSSIASGNSRWIEVQASLITGDMGYTPMLDDVAITWTTT